MIDSALVSTVGMPFQDIYPVLGETLPLSGSTTDVSKTSRLRQTPSHQVNVAKKKQEIRKAACFKGW